MANRVKAEAADPLEGPAGLRTLPTAEWT